MHNDRKQVFLFFPTLFLCDVKTTEVSFQCTLRSQPPKNQRVFPAAGPRSKSQPRASYQRPENEKTNRLVKTRFTWEPQSITVQSDSFAGLTNHVSTRPDKHSEEEIVQDIIKPAEQRLNCTVTGGSMVKETTLVEHHFDIQREWSRCGQLFRHALNKFKEYAPATCDTAYTLVDADVTLHEAQERIDVNSAGFSGRETYLEQHFRETEAFGADCDDVLVWERPNFPQSMLALCRSQG